MSNLVYLFTFPRRALGLDVVVTDSAGESVAIADDPTLTLTADNGNAYIELSLPHENAPYSAAVASSRIGAFSTEGQVALAESIADTPGATETAYFIATGSGVTDETDDPATVIADPDHGALPSWISLAGNTITFEESVLVTGSAVGAFTANFPTDLPGGGDGYVSLFCDAYLSTGGGQAWFGTDYYSNDLAAADLDVEGLPFIAAQTYVPAGTTVEFAFQGQAYQSDGSTPVADGTYSGTAYFQFRLDATAPTLPA